MNSERTFGIYLIALIVASLLAGGDKHPAWADAAPPERPPGSSVGPGEAVTQVQMVSEEVLLEIEGQDTAKDEPQGLAAGLMTGRVEAVFLMRNQGETEESFDVWFPLGVPNGYGNVASVENFRAWVNDVPAQVSEAERVGKWDTVVPWATWPATFPPGQDVVLRVVYDVVPDGYSPYGTFPYVLETGAGWWGPIGDGVITFRLPFDVNETNTVLNPEVYNGAQVDWLSPNPTDYAVSGSEVVWRFTNLEPTAENNIQLTVLAPALWDEIVAARQEAEANPERVESQLQLARALNRALSFKYGLNPIGNSLALAKEADAAYLRALELTPADVESYVEYLQWLQLFPEPGLPILPENMLPNLERALELAPDDQRLLDLQRWVEQLEPPRTRPTPPTAPTSTATAIPSPTATVTVTPPPTATSVPTATPTRTRVEPTASVTATAASSPSPTSPPAPSTTAAPTATEEPDSGSGGGLCPGAVAMGLLPLGVWVARRSRKAK